MQCFASYGGAARTPVSSFLRVDDRPIRERCDISVADAILCFDASLLAPPLLARARRAHTDRRQLAAQPRAEFARAMPDRRVIPVDGLGISRRLGLGRIVNSALLGALARALERRRCRCSRRRADRALAEAARREHRRLRDRLARRRCAAARGAVAMSALPHDGTSRSARVYRDRPGPARPADLDHRLDRGLPYRHLARGAAAARARAVAMPPGLPGRRRYRRVDRPRAPA
ncbi:MAG: hypothetical protein HS128_07225 [Ideonella sp.]|nr:hypothetical protein [Ideonella sp.]